MSPRGRELAFDSLVLALAKAALGAWLLRLGFSQVSDDDYARTVIAEAFAHAPKLDPSGTSWLPLPFWVTGIAMMAAGRSLEVARGVAFAVGAASVAAPYVAMRAAGCARATAWIAVGLAMALPWSAWLGVATVPEAMTACLVAAGVIAGGAAGRGAGTAAGTAERARVLAGAALLAAALSRYEAWPACAVFAVCLLLRRREARGAEDKVAALLALIGPLAWILWNAYVHGSPLHFLARVSTYRAAIGAAPASLTTRLTSFPLALASTSPSLALAALVALPVLALDPAARARWTCPLLAAAAILAFLVVGDVTGGAPTHHPERALLPVLWLLAAFAVDAWSTLALRLTAWRPPDGRWLQRALAVALAVFAATLPARWKDYPGASEAESRAAQIARGRELAAAPPAHITLTPCAYEHFALLAAFGAPERATILPATHDPVTADCPRLELR